MKQIFFKTVKEDYTSLYARGILKRKYEVNKRYRFPEDLPAHGFSNGNIDLSDPLQRNLVYRHRYERDLGNRVLVCYGEAQTRDLFICDVCADIWDLNNPTNMLPVRNLTSTDFIVIDELELPEECKGKRPSEFQRRKYEDTVILSKKLEKQMRKLSHL